MSTEENFEKLVTAVAEMNWVIKHMADVHGELLKEAYININVLENQVEYLTKELSEIKNVNRR